MRSMGKTRLFRFSAVCFMAAMPIISEGHQSIHYRTLHQQSDNPRRSVTIQQPSSSRNSSPQDAVDRRGCDLLKSVIAYLNWRRTSSEVPFASWRNQPSAVGDLSHAINLCNQALNQAGELTLDSQIERWFAESPTLRAKYEKDFTKTDAKRSREPYGRSAQSSGEKLSPVSGHGGSDFGRRADLDGSEPPAIIPEKVKTRKAAA